jgi:hypothetical protein
MRVHLIGAMALAAGAAAAGPATVLTATATPMADARTVRIDATVAHQDTGWDHYADAWRVETTDGVMLGMRELLHPHVHEQPFTRSLSGVVVPPGASVLIVRARDSVHGWGETTATIALPDR